MRQAPKLLIVLAALVVPALAGCGGGSSSTNTASTQAAGDQAGSTASVPTTHHDSGGGGVAQFRGKGGDNSIQDFGAEAGGAERQRVAAALHGYLDARARGDWATACSYMSAKLKQGNAQLAAGSPQLASKGCAAITAALYSSVPAKGFRDAAKADVGSFRLKGARGFLLYHGSHRTDYAMPMVLEGGHWKVALASGNPLY